MNKTTKIVLGVLVAIGVVWGGVTLYKAAHKQLPGAASTFGSLFVVPNSGQGDNYVLAFGTSIYGTATTLVNSAGAWVGAITTTASTTFSGNCTTTTWNPSAVGSTTVATINVTTTGATFGDLAYASIATNTQGLALDAEVSSTNVIAVSLADQDNSGAAIDITTTTVRACFIH